MSNRRAAMPRAEVGGRRTGGERSPDQISEGFARAPPATVRRLSAGRAVPVGCVPTSQRGGNGHPHRREPLSSAATASERRRATAQGGSTGGSIGDAPPFAAARPTGMRANGMWSGPRKVGGADGKDVAERPSPSSIPRRVGRVDAAKTTPTAGRANATANGRRAAVASVGGVVRAAPRLGSSDGPCRLMTTGRRRTLSGGTSRLIREDEELQAARRRAAEEARRRADEEPQAARWIEEAGREPSRVVSGRRSGFMPAPRSAGVEREDNADENGNRWGTVEAEEAEMAKAIEASIVEYNNDIRRLGRRATVTSAGVSEDPETDVELQRALQVSYESAAGLSRGGGGEGHGRPGGSRSGRGLPSEDLPAWLLDESAEDVFLAASQAEGGFGVGIGGGSEGARRARAERQGGDDADNELARALELSRLEFESASGRTGYSEEEALAATLEASRRESVPERRKSSPDANARATERRNTLDGRTTHPAASEAAEAVRAAAFQRDLAAAVDLDGRLRDVRAVRSNNAPPARRDLREREDIAAAAAVRREQDEAFRAGLAADRRREAAEAEAEAKREAAAAAVAAEAARARETRRAALEFLRALASQNVALGEGGSGVDVDADGREVMIDVAPLGIRLRRRFEVSASCAAVYGHVRRGVACEVLAEIEGAGDGGKVEKVEAAAALVKGAFTLVPAFGGGCLPDAAGVTLGDAGVARRDKFIVRDAV